MNFRTLFRPAIFYLLLIVPSFPTPGYTSEWDFEYWQYLNWKNWERGPYKLYTIGEIRADRDLSKVYYYRITENFAYQPFPNLTLEAHYSFLYNQSRGASRFTNTQRLEFEVNPTLPLDNGLTLNWRNRIEFLKRQQVSEIRYIFRHRLKIAFPIEDCGHLTAINMSDEVFYHFDTNKFTQNRFVPIEASFTLSQNTAINVFLMIRNFFSSNAWYRSIVIGSELIF